MWLHIRLGTCNETSNNDCYATFFFIKIFTYGRSDFESFCFFIYEYQSYNQKQISFYANVGQYICAFIVCMIFLRI